MEGRKVLSGMLELGSTGSKEPIVYNFSPLAFSDIKLGNLKLTIVGEFAACNGWILNSSLLPSAQSQVLIIYQHTTEVLQPYPVVALGYQIPSDYLSPWDNPKSKSVCESLFKLSPFREQSIVILFPWASSTQLSSFVFSLCVLARRGLTMESCPGPCLL